MQESTFDKLFKRVHNAYPKLDPPMVAWFKVLCDILDEEKKPKVVDPKNTPIDLFSQEG